MDILKKAAQELKDRVNKTSQIEKLLQEATSKDNWQAHPKTLNSIADFTNSGEEWNIISKYLWDKLYRSDKSWIVTFKTLVLIEHLLKNGSPRCIMEFKDELYKIKKLQDFQFSEGGEDKGVSVRQRSKNIVDLLTDEDKLDHERQTAKELRDKMNSVNGGQLSATTGQNSNLGPSQKYAGFSKDTFKDQKYGGISSKNASINFYKTGDSYDVTEFKGLDKYRKKDEKEENATKENIEKFQEEEKKKQPHAVVPVLPKPGEVHKAPVGQIKISPPTGTVQTPVQVTGSQAPKLVSQQIDFFEMDDPVPSKPIQQVQNQEEDWDWSNAPVQKPHPPAQKPQAVAPSTNIYQQQQQQQQQQQYPQQQQQQQGVFPQYNGQGQQMGFQPQIGFGQQNFLQSQMQQFPQQVQQPTQVNKQPEFDLFQSKPTGNIQNNKNNDQDLFSEFQGSTQQSNKTDKESKTYSKDEFDLINLGDMKKEAEKKQKEKEIKNQSANDFGFSTLNTQLDQFSMHNSSNPNSQYNMPSVNQQSNLAALNNLNAGWIQPTGYGMHPQNMGGFPNTMPGYGQQQNYPMNMGGYGQPNIAFSHPQLNTGYGQNNQNSKYLCNFIH